MTVISAFSNNENFLLWPFGNEFSFENISYYLGTQRKLSSVILDHDFTIFTVELKVNKSCAELFQFGINSSGVYTIYPDGGKPIQLLCDMTTDGGDWTVFQKRLDGSVDFYLGWESYKNGFGDLNGEFWVGNDNLHRLTAADDVILRVDLEDFDGNIGYAEYTTFKVADEGDKYRLLIGGYSGTASDSMTVHRCEEQSFTYYRIDSIKRPPCNKCPLHNNRPPRP